MALSLDAIVADAAARQGKQSLQAQAEERLAACIHHGGMERQPAALPSDSPSKKRTSGKKNEYVHTYYPPEERDIVAAAAEARGISVSAHIRQAALLAVRQEDPDEQGLLYDKYVRKWAAEVQHLLEQLRDAELPENAVDAIRKLDKATMAVLDLMEPLEEGI